MQPSLTSIMRGFFGTERKQKLTLKGGLGLAYTPPAENQGFHRLTISRKGVSPSATEQQVIRSTLKPLINMRTKIGRAEWIEGKYFCVTYTWPDPKFQPELPLEV